ncbi:NAD(P)-binding protein [Piedraia hortae CBS 480.64]|uniref:NAD(P)-binding protein n=1 Tax=Piedraia hortae CBS 480.64 TaxID=1314780 RepID=A0A6A7BTL6_9PEZI|nr:NAD(P)-binding protein [Piedraia hortae CBS 480.64]
MTQGKSQQIKFPAHKEPRVWFVTCVTSPIGISLCRHALEHGDFVAGGVPSGDASPTFTEFLEQLRGEPLWASRLSLIALDSRNVANSQSAVAEAVNKFGRIDILFCCDSEVVIGTIEELSQDSRTRALVHDQFESNFFGPVNVIRTALPVLRKQNNGHILLLSAITGHLGTPGLGMYCASQWAIEGYCDSLAYEVAPFNIKITILQPNMEVTVFTHKITSVPPMSAYAEGTNPAPLSRNIFSGLLDRLEGTAEPTLGDQLHSNEVTSIYPPLSSAMTERLVAETVHAVLSIGGHENPPVRHIVGVEGVTAVMEKLKTVSKELEDFVECSNAVDYEPSKG